MSRLHLAAVLAALAGAGGGCDKTETGTGPPPGASCPAPAPPAGCAAIVTVGAAPPPPPNLPPVAVFKTDPDPAGGVISGPAPFSVRFNLCASNHPELGPRQRPTDAHRG